VGADRKAGSAPNAESIGIERVFIRH